MECEQAKELFETPPAELEEGLVGFDVEGVGCSTGERAAVHDVGARLFAGQQAQGGVVGQR